MEISLKSSDTDAELAFREIVPDFLDDSDRLVSELVELLQTAGIDSIDLAKADFTEWANSLARAKAVLQIGCPHPAIITNFEGHHTGKTTLETIRNFQKF